MIDLSRGLRHLAWADDKLFAALATLPPEAFAARYAPDAWPVGQLASHIVGGAEWYCYCLAGMRWTDLRPAQNAADVERLRVHLAGLNAVIRAEALKADERLTFDDEGGPGSVMRSTLLTQAILHSIEHRAQIACALELAGYDVVRLDDYDMWHFETVEG